MINWEQQGKNFTFLLVLSAISIGAAYLIIKIFKLKYDLKKLSIRIAVLIILFYLFLV
jgi:uncharacterized membrane protein YraQ (UPF0718 family)